MTHIVSKFFDIMIYHLNCQKNILDHVRLNQILIKTAEDKNSYQLYEK